MLQQYRLVKQIGKGGFAQTFMAVDESQSPQSPCVVQQISLQYQQLEDLQQKARILQKLGDYLQIPKLKAWFQAENYFYLAQEYIDGLNLNTQLEQQGVFSEVQIWQILTAILPILKILHSQNLIHCDIKPENLIFNNTQNSNSKTNLYLVDFAASQLATISNTAIGNPEYSPPEQTQGKPIFTSDLYSLGVTCIYLLTNISPFYLIDIANTKWIWRDYLQSKVSETLSNILDKLMEKDVNCRFQSIDEVMQAMGLSWDSTLKPKKRNPELDCLHTLKVGSGTRGGIANAVAFSLNRILASGNDDKTITIWDLDAKQVLHTLAGHSQAVTSVAFSPDGDILATASDDKTIKLWDAAYQEICTLTGHTRAVKSIAFSPDGILASGSWDKSVKLWNVETRSEIGTLTGHQLQISALAFSPDGNFLASASFDKTIRLWNLTLKNQPCRIFVGHTWAVLAVAFSPDGKILATGSDDNTIKLWEVETGREIATLANHSWSVTGLSFVDTGEILISGSKDKTIKLWQVSNNEEIVTLSGHEDSLTAIAVNFSDAGQLIVSSSKDKTIKLWDLRGILDF